MAIVRTGDSDDLEARDLSDLIGGRIHCTGGTRDEKSLASLDLPNVDQVLNVPNGIKIWNRKYAQGWFTKYGVIPMWTRGPKEKIRSGAR